MIAATAEPLLTSAGLSGLSDYQLPDFRDFRSSATTATAAAPGSTGSTLRSNLGSSLGGTSGGAVVHSALVSELLTQLGPSAPPAESWLVELREAHSLLRQGAIDQRDYLGRKAATLGRLKYLKPTIAQAAERSAGTFTI